MAETSKELKPRTILRDLPRKDEHQPTELTEKEAEAVKGGMIGLDGDPDDDPRLP